MRHPRSPFLLPLAVAFSALALASPLRSQAFTRVIGAGDALPGLPSPLGSISEAPGMSGDHIAFVGTYQEGAGFVTAVFSNASGSFEIVARTGQTMPTESVPFQFLFRMAVDGDSVAVLGSSFVGGIAREGIYGNHTGALTEYVDRSDFIPGGSGPFTQIANRPFSMDGGRAVFNGSGNSQQRGVYMVDAFTGFVQRIADGSTATPGQPAGSTFFTFGAPHIHAERVSFAASSSTASGIYDQYGAGVAPLQLLADTSTVLPFGGTANLLAAIAIDEADSVIQAYSPDAGLHTHVDNQLATLADGATPIPGGSGTFPEFNNFAISGGRVVFEAYDFIQGGQLGVFTNWCGALTPLVVPGDVIDGQVVQHVLFDEDSLDGDQLLASISFTSGLPAIYLIDLSAVRHYGEAYASPGNLRPTLSAIGCPAPGSAVEFRLRDGPVGGGGFLASGLAAASVPFFNGGTLLVQPDFLHPISLEAPTSVISGGWHDSLQQVPNDPAFSGVTFYAQAVLRDPLLAGAWLFSDGLELPIQ
ncbi:MAG: hypothetical protein DHS20C15_26940 [Planctomycetota bacterium]|nr:MAG: hypothetical protein DHS20C15_26940 [Planctomycetota bacterium]